MINHGALVISLDFEMMWGCHERNTPEKYGISNINNVRRAINLMLDVFHKYGVHATFATVGLIMCQNKDDVSNYMPRIKPTYLIKNHSPFRDSYIDNIEDKYSHLYFAPDVIEILKSSEGIEIATHTFSHFFCWDKGQTLEQFESDIDSAKTVANKYGIQLNSIVFPKNQVSKEYLSVCNAKGIDVYRGNAKKFFSEPKSKFQEIKNRIVRLIDAYICIGGMTSIPYREIEIQQHQPINISASRMLRQFIPKLSMFEGLRLRRIKKEMLYAAKNNEMYHLWWHPHNFGDYVEQNITFLEEVLKSYNKCHEKYNMQSYNMGEMKELLLSNNLHA